MNDPMQNRPVSSAANEIPTHYESLSSGDSRIQNSIRPGNNRTNEIPNPFSGTAAASTNIADAPQRNQLPTAVAAPVSTAATPQQSTVATGAAANLTAALDAQPSASKSHVALGVRRPTAFCMELGSTMMQDAIRFSGFQTQSVSATADLNSIMTLGQPGCLIVD
ncbi:MAG: hypothetical protein AAFN70_11210, partial [Planctomycetota bacterium]